MHERVQRKNPYNLTVRQHILPQFLIKRFCNDIGCVDFFDLHSAQILKVTPKDIKFCTKRVWDQCAEAGFMKSIEDMFLDISEEIISNNNYRLSDSENAAICEMLLLWRFRELYRDVYPEAISLNGIKPPSVNFSVDYHEKLESSYVMSVDNDGKIPARHMVGLKIQKYIMTGKQAFTDNKWAIVYAQEGEFLVPDNPKYDLIPISPCICLIWGEKNKILTKEAVKDTNLYSLAAIKNFYFGRNLADCPSIIY